MVECGPSGPPAHKFDIFALRLRRVILKPLSDFLKKILALFDSGIICKGTLLASILLNGDVSGRRSHRIAITLATIVCQRSVLPSSYSPRYSCIIVASS